MKDFCLNYTKLARKAFVRLLPTNFLPQRKGRPVFGVTSKKDHCVFLQMFGAIFARIVKDLTQIFRGFAQIFRVFPKFSTNQNFGGCVCAPALPSPTPLPQPLLSHFHKLLHQAKNHDKNKLNPQKQASSEITHIIVAIHVVAKNSGASFPHFLTLCNSSTITLLNERT